MNLNFHYDRLRGDCPYIEGNNRKTTNLLLNR